MRARVPGPTDTGKSPRKGGRHGRAAKEEHKAGRIKNGGDRTDTGWLAPGSVAGSKVCDSKAGSLEQAAEAAAGKPRVCPPGAD